MKTVYKFLTLCALAIVFAAANTATTFAQDDPAATAKNDLYTKFYTCYKETAQPARDNCYAVAKEYIDKYGSDNDDYIKFVKKRYDAYTQEKASAKKVAILSSFDSSIKDPKNMNIDTAFTTGKDAAAADPDLIDVPIVLASIGFDAATAATPNDKYNADTINYAKTAIQKIESGKTSDQYGAYNYTYKSQKYPDGKNNTLGWMNYTIGYIMYYRQNQKKEALPYLYKATQINSGTKNTSEVYRSIGSYYVDEFKRLDDDRVAKIKAAGDQDTDETKSLFAVQKGYAERAADAYARAYKIASANTTATKEYKDGLLTRAKQFYGIRFNNDLNNTKGFDEFLAGVTNKPMADPATAVVPVVETAPATTPTPAATPAAPATTTKPATTPAKPAATTKPTAAAPTTTVTTTEKTPTTKTPAKPAATKKKGTR